LRGRYEVQIEDNYGQEPDSHKIGGIYGFLTPCLNAAKKPGEWQTMDITLVGRVVTVVFNGERVIDRQTIPGITGGALDSDEGAPGPLLLQGDHGPIEFRKVTLIPSGDQKKVRTRLYLDTEIEKLAGKQIDGLKKEGILLLRDVVPAGQSHPRS